MNELPDPLQELLQPLPAREPMGLRERMRDQTSRLVRRRLILRRVATAVVAAACLLVAALVGYVIRPKLEPIPTTPPFVEAPRAPEIPQEAPVNPVDLEWQAFDSQKNRAASYFLAGNKYLEASEDVESALRCYTQALNACTPAELEITPDDNWLVVTLKNARLKERSHD